MHCGQELNPGQYTSTNIVHAGAKFRCSLNVLNQNGSYWTQQLPDGETAALVGLLADGSVVGELHAKDGTARLVLWRNDHDPEPLPWLPSRFAGTIVSTAHDFSRYAVFATNDPQTCNPITRIFGTSCDESGEERWVVFDRKSNSPLVNRPFPKNGRAALSPDGYAMHHSSLES
jgi:hypothetical protein